MCTRHRQRVYQGRSDGEYIGIYILRISLPYKFLCGYWLFFLFDPGQIRYRASVRLSSCFFYLLTHHNLYPQMKFLATPLVCTVADTRWDGMGLNGLRW